MFLFRDVMDKELVDCHDDKIGKVDDLLLELRPGNLPAVTAILTGHGASASLMPNFLRRITEWLEGRLLGLPIEPFTIGWKHVTRIDVVVYLDLDREKDGLLDTETAIWNRWIKHLPWAQR